MHQIQNSVGRGGDNQPVDVRIVQQLLANFALIPYRTAPVTGICDDLTITLIEAFQHRFVGMSNPTGRVEPESRTWYALNGVSRSGPTGNYTLDEAIGGMQSEAANFAARWIPDARVREGYIAESQRYANELIEAVRSGRLSPQDAAETANLVRNELLETGRLNSSDIGRAVAENIKRHGRTLTDLQDYYARRLFSRTFSELTESQQNQVFLEVVRASGRPNPRVSVAARRLGRVGRGLIFVAIAISVYNIATAEDPGRETAREAVGFGAGFAGSVAGGALAGLACGPGAPVCVAIGVFVGGALFALGADLTFDWLAR